MLQIITKVKNLRLVESFANEPTNSVGRVKSEDTEEYTEVGLEGHENKTNFYFSCPVHLLHPDLKIGDEVVVTFSKKEA